MRGGSLALVGAMMLGMVKAPAAWVVPMPGAAGALLALRGLLSIAVLARGK